MKKYDNPYKFKYCFYADIENADDTSAGSEKYPVFAKDIGDAARKANKYAQAKRNGTYYVQRVSQSEAPNHVIY